jgi:hypothetical protein
MLIQEVGVKLHWVGKGNRDSKVKWDKYNNSKWDRIRAKVLFGDWIAIFFLEISLQKLMSYKNILF